MCKVIFNGNFSNIIDSFFINIYIFDIVFCLILNFDILLRDFLYFILCLIKWLICLELIFLNVVYYELDFCSKMRFKKYSLFVLSVFVWILCSDLYVI